HSFHPMHFTPQAFLSARVKVRGDRLEQAHTHTHPHTHPHPQPTNTTTQTHTHPHTTPPPHPPPVCVRRQSLHRSSCESIMAHQRSCAGTCWPIQSGKEGREGRTAREPQQKLSFLTQV